MGDGEGGRDGWDDNRWTGLIQQLLPTGALACVVAANPGSYLLDQYWHWHDMSTDLHNFVTTMLYNGARKNTVFTNGFVL